MWERREGEPESVGKEIGSEEMGGYFGLDALLKLKKDCIVAMTPRNDILMIFTVIASEAKQSQKSQFHGDLMGLTRKSEGKTAALIESAFHLNVAA
jgi:hypothetical protein